jgi:hypothetical protein
LYQNIQYFLCQNSEPYLHDYNKVEYILMVWNISIFRHKSVKRKLTFKKLLNHGNHFDKKFHFSSKKDKIRNLKVCVSHFSSLGVFFTMAKFLDAVP